LAKAASDAISLTARLFGRGSEKDTEYRVEGSTDRWPTMKHERFHHYSCEVVIYFMGVVNLGADFHKLDRIDATKL
jgi:hypothetical protein